MAWIDYESGIEVGGNGRRFMRGGFTFTSGTVSLPLNFSTVENVSVIPTGTAAGTGEVRVNVSAGTATGKVSLSTPTLNLASSDTADSRVFFATVTGY